MSGVVEEGDGVSVVEAGDGTVDSIFDELTEARKANEVVKADAIDITASTNTIAGLFISLTTTCT